MRWILAERFDVSPLSARRGEIKIDASWVAGRFENGGPRRQFGGGRVAFDGTTYCRPNARSDARDLKAFPVTTLTAVPNGTFFAELTAAKEGNACRK
jgi:hypothetical protein